METPYVDFSCSLLNAKEALERDGVCVIPNVLPEQDLVQARTGMWDAIEQITSQFEGGGILRDAPETYGKLRQLFPIHSMILQHWGIGHSQFCWDVRSHPGVVHALGSLYRVPSQRLITSFDGASIHLPDPANKRGYYRNPWYHTDQASTTRGHMSWQGLVNLFDVEEGDATLCVLKGSHLKHAAYFDQFGIVEKKNWYKLPSEPEHMQFFKDQGCTPAAILAKAGDLVLWDSRTFHFGREPLKQRVNSDRLRAVVYTCLTPRSKASNKAQEKRRKAFAELRMTTHLPHAPTLFPKTPRTYGQQLPRTTALPAPVLSELAKKLV